MLKQGVAGVWGYLSSDWEHFSNARVPPKCDPVFLLTRLKGLPDGEDGFSFFYPESGARLRISQGCGPGLRTRRGSPKPASLARFWKSFQ